MKHLQFLLRPVLFFLLLFAAFRVAFLLFFAGDEPAGQWLYAFVVGLRLDLSVSAYIQLLPFLLWILSFEKAEHFVHIVLCCYYFLVLLLLTLLEVSNLVIYRYWETLVNWRALSYLSEPKEAMASVSILQLLLWVLLTIALVYFLARIFFSRFYRRPVSPRPWLLRLAAFVIIPGLLLLAMRGGWQLLPVNESVAYYSSSRTLNDAATNCVWHLGHGAKMSSATGNPFVAMKQEEAKRITNSLLVRSPAVTAHILKNDRPNIVLLVLESFSSDLLGCLGASPSATPFLDSLAGKGMLFTHLYASGFRTDQGLPSLLSGFPATPVFSVIRYPEKSAHLPSLVRVLEQQGYATSYFYGGAGNFRNMKAYCFGLGFDIFRDQEDFSTALPQNKWGVHDEYVLQRQAEELHGMKTPFFSVVMTLSNHEPYEVPMAAQFTGEDDASKFRNSARYTDVALQKYFAAVAKEPWYSNTLFILVADHGHALPMHRPMSEPSSHRIPLIFFSPAMKEEYAGKQVTVIGNHHDVPATLLRHLGMEAKDFPWSRDLLDSTAKSFAYYEQEDGFGWIEQGGWIYYSAQQKRIILKSQPVSDEAGMIHRGSAYLQVLFEDYLKY